MIYPKEYDSMWYEWIDEDEEEDEIEYTDPDELGDFLYHQWKDDQE